MPIFNNNKKTTRHVKGSKMCHILRKQPIETVLEKAPVLHLAETKTPKQLL